MRHPAREGDTVVRDLLAELEGLVRVAARRPDVTVRAGEPGCAWSFNFGTGVVVVDPESLRTLAPDLCRGLALHEATHAAVTVLQQFLPAAVLARLMPLLNVIEDIRIEIWMRSRFPGAAPWIRAYNDVFHGLVRSRPLPRSRQVQFLQGVLDLWWLGTTAAGTLPEVLDALDRCREPIAAAVDCQPPLEHDPDGVVSSQKAMWEIVRERIVPAWERLVALDREEGIGPLAAAECREFVDAWGGQRCGGSPVRTRLPAGPRRAGDGCGLTRAGRAPGPAGDDVREAIAASLGADHADAYLTAWRRIAPAANRLGDELLRVLLPSQRMRWQTGNPSGARLDLRRAMQFEADPRLHRSLWCRPVLPSRRDPALLLLIDRSGSMGSRRLIDRAFEGLVLMVEVCRRIGVPAAVWSFADRPREELSWTAPLDPVARRRLGLLPARCDGNTEMAGALDAVRTAFAGRHGHPKILVVLGDGEPSRPQRTIEAVARLEEEGVATVGLGLGPGTKLLERYFRCAAVEIPPDRIVDHVARVLETAVLEQAGRAAAV